jgi:hypothetical protein
MKCGTCGNKKKPVIQSPSVQVLNYDENYDIMYMEYALPNTETRSIRGPVTKQDYRFGNTENYRIKRVGRGPGEVDPNDAKEMLRIRIREGVLFRAHIQKRPAITPPPVVEKVEIVVKEDVRDELVASVPPISDYSVKTVRDLIEQKIDKFTVAVWLEQERSSETPRKGMLSLLESYVG